ELSTAIGKNQRSDFIELEDSSKPVQGKPNYMNVDHNRQHTSFGSGFKATGFGQPTGFGQQGFGRGVWTEPQTRVERETHNSYEHRMRKLMMPVFDGEDAYGWIYRVERYFEIQGIPPQEQLRVVVVCMEGPFLVSLERGSNPFFFMGRVQDTPINTFPTKTRPELFQKT
ncbi:hypothetical protein Tco_0330210, partial [Tanacetum coccineum]